MATPSLSKELAQEAIDAVVLHGGVQARAAEQLGINHSTLRGRLASAKRYGLDFSELDELRKPKLILKGQSILYGPNGEYRGRWDKSTREGRAPEDVEHIPDPKKIAKLSTLYDQQGRVTQQWISERPDDAERDQLWRIFAEELSAKIDRLKPLPAPKGAFSKDLLACYPVGDHHHGMLAWAEETGSDNWDLRESERALELAVDHLVAAMPACETALLAFLGDFQHYDSFAPVTPTNRNLLDADSRFPKMVRVAVRSMRRTIDKLLAKHRKVHVIIESGNHDLASTVFLVECLRAAYEKEPRVSIDTSPSHYHYFEFGRCLIGTHHGHGAKLDRLPGIMAHDRAEAWGRTRWRTWWTGHIHQDSQKDFPGCTVESMRVLAPVDAWGGQKGYRPIRSMKALVLHREHGEQARHTVNSGMFRRVAQQKRTVGQKARAA